MSRGKIYICDFNDSFTYNIFSVLRLMDSSVEIEVIPLERALSFLQILSESKEKCGVILGPGPGHPNDYSHLMGTIQKLMDKKSIFLMGICLGHQLIWNCLGGETEHCGAPIHGQTQEYVIPPFLQEKLTLPDTITVQRYNSLAVKINTEQLRQKENQGWKFLVKHDELVMSYLDNILTYQFHPESIGTMSSESFFNPLIQEVR